MGSDPVNEQRNYVTQKPSSEARLIGNAGGWQFTGKIGRCLQRTGANLRRIAERSGQMSRTAVRAKDGCLQRAPTRLLNCEMRISAIHANKKLREYPNAGLVQILDTRKMEDHLGSKFLLTI